MRMMKNVLINKKGQVLAPVLALLAIGALAIGPALDNVSTGLRANSTVKHNVMGLYAADAGIEDGMWRLLHSPPALPYSYTLPQTVDQMTVTVDLAPVEMFSGIDTGDMGPHPDFVQITTTLAATATPGKYQYNLLIKNMQTSEISVKGFIFQLPLSFSYAGPTSGITTQAPSTTTSTYLNLSWSFSPPNPKIGKSDPKKGVYTTATLQFILSGPPGLTPAELASRHGFGIVDIVRSDIDWIATMLPATITATATDSQGKVQGKIKAGVYIGASVSVAYWRINP